MDLVQRLTIITQYGAAWVLWLLLTLSIVGIAITLERFASVWSTRDDYASLTESLRSALKRQDLDAARRLLEESPSTEARVARAALCATHKDGIPTRIQSALDLTRLDLERRLAFLATLGNNAPFVGLLGTVIGIVRAFRELEQSQGAVSTALLREVGEALVATAVGLLVALPAVAAFNWFQRLIQTRLVRGESLAREVLAHFEEQSHV